MRRFVLRWGSGLLAEPESLNGRAVALEILPLQVIEQAAAAADQLEQAAAAVMVLGVGLEVLGQLGDAVGEQGHLHLRGPRVGVVDTVVLDHSLSALSLLQNALSLCFTRSLRYFSRAD